MNKFEYLMPATIDEAISFCISHGERAKYIAGGTDVMVKLKEGKINPLFAPCSGTQPHHLQGRGIAYRGSGHPSNAGAFSRYQKRVSDLDGRGHEYRFRADSKRGNHRGKHRQCCSVGRRRHPLDHFGSASSAARSERRAVHGARTYLYRPGNDASGAGRDFPSSLHTPARPTASTPEEQRWNCLFSG